MNILVVGRDARTHTVIEGLLASPLWCVTHCDSVAEAAERLATSQFDYVFVEPQFEAEFEALRDAPESNRRGQVIYVDWQGGVLPAGRGGGVFGMYPAGVNDAGQAEGPWVFEYHAPCRRAG